MMRVRLYIVALQVPAPKHNKQLYSDIDEEETEESDSDSDSRSNAVQYDDTALDCHQVAVVHVAAAAAAAAAATATATATVAITVLAPHMRHRDKSELCAQSAEGCRIKKVRLSLLFLFSPAPPPPPAPSAWQTNTLPIQDRRDSACATQGASV